MARWIAGAACAAAVLSLTLASAQSGRGRKPDQPSTASQAAKARQATITGCVVRDAANGGQATIESNGIAYRLMGRRDAELEKYLGKRVEVTGTIDSGSTGARATGGKTEAGESGAPKDQTATGGQSDVTATGTPRDNTVPPADAVPLATARGTTADLTGRMQIKTLRIVSPSCL